MSTKPDISAAPLAVDYRVDQQIGFMLRQANQRHVAIFAARMGDKLTTMQWSALIKLREIQPSSQNQLGREIAMDAATTKGVIDRLVARGYVSTSPDPEDGRRVILSLTEAGDEAVERNLASAQTVTEETLAPLSVEERSTLLSLIRKLC
ncbi:DNA-binding MarR family transcriptional regulator [Rhizobium sp. SG_E_25_P2]|jgi:MarR family transcriptional regulator, lower aerobic nicotinate degradation pathway regulator|uniref:MarR family winged helix-turn-helix transcriptional regulator n=1 Tax=Rhizobium sp. SG_E_25_P2 TaxID=2879942 RepID=UPI002476FABB|nr:MarR family transcriptional regulator [Rhizobium sp. SG_E_25_P2]MDH6266230.1 DNA-binding MarR family transcriptional regulator [Rhizobium sp. SG_E_25_P2]